MCVASYEQSCDIKAQVFAVSMPVGEPFTVNAHAAVGGGMNEWRRSAFNAAKAGRQTVEGAEGREPGC